MSRILNIATYRFVAIADTAALKAEWLPKAQALGLKGTILVAPEGINMFLAGAETTVRGFLAMVNDDPRFSDLDVKESLSDEVPFKRIKIKLKPEIVTFRQERIDPVNAPFVRAMNSVPMLLGRTIVVSARKPLAPEEFRTAAPTG